MSRESFEKMLRTDIPDISGKELWIFGAGNTANLYYNGLQRLEQEGFVISGYVDNNKDKWGKEFNGKTVVSLASLEDVKDKICILLCSIQGNVVKAVSEQLKAAGFMYYLIDDVVLKQHADKVMEVYDLFEDDESRELYEILTKERLTGEGKYMPVDPNEQYFALPPFAVNSPGEVFVDCGSYVGDTIERFLWKKEGVFKKIIAFEPDTHNVEAMNYRIERLEKEWSFGKDKIVVYAKGVSDKCLKAEVERYDTNNGLGSKISSSDSAEEGDDIVALDDFLKEPYTFLKADIESWEYKMLQGAVKGIREYKPLLAICIYHNVVDFYEIPLLIKSINKDYKISIRQHNHVNSDTVAYAWI